MKSEIIVWNNIFPLDRWWRLKYKVPYNSNSHLEVSQVDIFFDWYEEVVFNESVNYQKELVEKKVLLEKGELLTRRSKESIVDEEELFENLDLSNFNIE